MYDSVSWKTTPKTICPVIYFFNAATKLSVVPFVPGLIKLVKPVV